MDLAYQMQQFGLDDKESLVYLAILELGYASVQNIAQKAGIHRVTTYDIIEKLIIKGLTSVVNKGKKRYFMAVEPDKILDSLHYKEQLFTGLMPQLEALQSKSGNRPKVYYYEGREAVLNAYFDRLRHRPEQKENLMYGSSEKIQTLFPEGYKKFTNERLARGIKAKIIVEYSSFGLGEKRTGDNQLREVKFLPGGKKFNSSTIIYGDRMMIVSWDSMLLVIVEDKNNADNQRVLFNLLWESLPTS